MSVINNFVHSVPKKPHRAFLEQVRSFGMIIEDIRIYKQFSLNNLRSKVSRIPENEINIITRNLGRPCIASIYSTVYIVSITWANFIRAMWLSARLRTYLVDCSLICIVLFKECLVPMKNW